MAYVAKQEGRIQSPIYIEVSAEVLLIPGVHGSLGMSNKSGVEVLPFGKVASLLDIEVIYSRTDWKDAGIRDRLNNAKKFEVLVPQHIPLKYLRFT